MRHSKREPSGGFICKDQRSLRFSTEIALYIGNDIAYKLIYSLYGSLTLDRSLTLLMTLSDLKKCQKCDVFVHHLTLRGKLP